MSARKRARRVETEDESGESEEDSLSVHDDWADHLPDAEVDCSNFDGLRSNAGGDQPSNTASKDCGIIERVELRNFMCHENFEIDLDPRINFIEGRNGSGKSAIMTAIVVALGGRASITSRAQSVQAFVKAGESRALVAVTLCNDDGFDRKASFKYEDYGRSIVVERSFTKEGSSSYKLKSHTGRIISNKKQELDAIIHHFNIQTDNPVCVLNQEVSRNFLNSKNPRDKYEFFMRATQLEQLKRDYASAETSYEIAKQNLGEKKKVLPEVEGELKQLQYKVKMFNDIVDRQKNLKNLNKEALWACVITKEKELKLVEDEIVKVQNSTAESEGRVSQLKATKQEHEKRKGKLSSELQAIATESEQIRSQVELKKQAALVLKTEKAKMQSATNKYEHELKALMADKRSIGNRINDVKKQSTSEEEKMKRVQRLETLESELADLTNQERIAIVEKEELRTKISHLEDSISNLKEDRDHDQNSLRRHEADMVQLQKSRSNKLRRFGEHMPALIELIEEEHKKRAFARKPLGPFGYYIDVPQEAALAVESCLKNLVFSFWADNKADASRLRELMCKALPGRKPDIITRSFKSRFNVRSREVKCDKYKSILNLVKIKEDVIANALIDRASIETTLYVPDSKEAVDLLSDLSTVPENCRQAYTKDGTNMYPVTNRSTFRQYPNDKYASARYLQSSVAELLKDAKLSVEALTKALETKNATLKSLMEQRKEYLPRLKLLDTKLTHIKSKVRSINAEINALPNVEESTSAEVYGLEEELSNCEQKMCKANEIIENYRAKAAEIEERFDAANRELEEVDQKRKEHVNKRLPLREDYNKISAKLSEVEDALRSLQQNLKDGKKQLQHLEKTASAIRQELTACERRAKEKVPERIETNKSPEQLEAEIRELQEFLSEKENEIGNRQEITERFERAKNHYTRSKEAINALESVLEEFKDSLHRRATQYVELRSLITSYTSLIFQMYLDQVNFKGKLYINHKERVDQETGKVFKAKTLEIRVNPKANNQSVECKDTRSLSGGERAYSTVAFILALWDSCETPFRILDEFDCFMDMVTREIALGTFIEVIKQKNSKQYIFLTPLDIRHIAKDQTIKIHRMPTPARQS